MFEFPILPQCKHFNINSHSTAKTTQTIPLRHTKSPTRIQHGSQEKAKKCWLLSFSWLSLTIHPTSRLRLFSHSYACWWWTCFLPLKNTPQWNQNKAPTHIQTYMERKTHSPYRHQNNSWLTCSNHTHISTTLSQNRTRQVWYDKLQFCSYSPSIKPSTCVRNTGQNHCHCSFSIPKSHQMSELGSCTHSFRHTIHCINTIPILLEIHQKSLENRQTSLTVRSSMTLNRNTVSKSSYSIL